MYYIRGSVQVQPVPEWNLTSSPQPCWWKRAGTEMRAAQEAASVSIVNAVQYKKLLASSNFPARLLGSDALLSALTNEPRATLLDLFDDIMLKLPGGQRVHLSSAPTRLLMRF